MKLVGGLFSIVLALACAPFCEAQRPGRAQCEPRVAVQATVAAIAGDPEAWLGKCVTVPAIYNSERLYADEAAIYGDNANQIGGYVDGRGSLVGFWRGSFTGRVTDCAKAQGDVDSGLLRSPGILIDNTRQAGCPRPEGVFLLFMSQGELTPAALVRRVAPRTGNLVSPRSDWDHVDTVRLAGERFLAALRSGNRAALMGAAGGDYAVEQLLTDDTAFAALRATSGVLQSQILQSTAVAEPRFEGQVCWCLSSDCSRRWPVATRDADNQKGRPYACLRVGGPTGGDPGTRMTFAEVTYEGLPEPPRR
jgi:hypothetical protein